MFSEKNKADFLADELLIVRYSGEIPEVALQSSIYYLTQDPDGPAITLDAEDLALLKGAVLERYQEIIFRDLEPDNRDKGLYRGLARCVANWERLCRFCRREGRGIGEIRREVAKALQRFVERELHDVLSGSRTSCVNCSADELRHLAADLYLSDDDLPDGWQCLCG
jgi:hypothetical protein